MSCAPSVMKTSRGRLQRDDVREECREQLWEQEEEQHYNIQNAHSIASTNTKRRSVRIAAIAWKKRRLRSYEVLVRTNTNAAISAVGPSVDASAVPRTTSRVLSPYYPSIQEIYNIQPNLNLGLATFLPSFTNNVTGHLLSFHDIASIYRDPATFAHRPDDPVDNMVLPLAPDGCIPRCAISMDDGARTLFRRVAVCRNTARDTWQYDLLATSSSSSSSSLRRRLRRVVFGNRGDRVPTNALTWSYCASDPPEDRRPHARSPCGRHGSGVCVKSLLLYLVLVVNLGG
jgi:hypothetical protein